MYSLTVMQLGLKTAPNRLYYPHLHGWCTRLKNSPVPVPSNLRAEEVVEGEKKGSSWYEATPCFMSRNVSEKYRSQIHNRPLEC